MEKERKHDHPKGHNNFSVTDSKKLKIHAVSNMKFNVVVLRNSVNCKKKQKSNLTKSAKTSKKKMRNLAEVEIIKINQTEILELKMNEIIKKYNRDNQEQT